MCFRVQAGWNQWRKITGILCDRRAPEQIKGMVLMTDSCEAGDDISLSVPGGKLGILISATSIRFCCLFVIQEALFNVSILYMGWRQQQ